MFGEVDFERMGAGSELRRDAEVDLEYAADGAGCASGEFDSRACSRDTDCHWIVGLN